MHQAGVGAVVIDDIFGDEFAEIGLEAIHSHVEEFLEFAAIPGCGFGVCEIDEGHSWLPGVALEDAAIGTFEEIASFVSFIEDFGKLGDVGIDPEADFQAFGFQSLEHSFGVGKRFLIPLKITPVAFLHPEAIEMEDAEGDLALGHSIYELIYGCFVIFGGEGGAEPEAH